MAPRAVHHSHLIPVKDAWVMASGGRCYLRAEEKKKILDKVKCPKCSNKNLADQYGYEAHYSSCHSKED